MDRRLSSRASVTRSYLAGSVAIGLVATAAVVAQAVLIATVVQRVLVHHATLAEVAPQLSGLAGAFAARAALGWAGELAAQRTSVAITSELRRQLLHRALALGPSWLAGERAGELSLTATRGVSALETYFGRYLPLAIIAGLAPLGLLAWIGYADWPSALVLTGLLVLVPVLMILFGRESAKRTRRQWRRLSSLSGRLLELVQGLPTLRAFGRAGRGRREVAEATEGLRQATLATLRVAFLSALAMEVLSGLGVGLVAMLLGLRLLGGTVSLYSALAVLLVAPEVFLPLRRASAEYHASAEGQAAAERILDVLDVQGPAARTDSAPAAPPDFTAAPLRLTHASVAYTDRAEPALGPIDLLIESGEHLAVLGPSGSGKSTLLASLLGFVVPDTGSVTIGDVDLADVDLAAWRRSITWVPQRPHLFSATIAENLRIANPAASEEDMQWALSATALESFVAQLPAGLETAIGEGALELSAGERQRLAIARAVLRDAPVVLFDEPAAHLDASSEAALRAALAPWLERRTVVVAGHRPELVARIDRVVHLPLSAGTTSGAAEVPGATGGADGRLGAGSPEPDAVRSGQ